MKYYSINITSELSIGDIHYLEDYLSEYVDSSVIEQALEGVDEEDQEKAYHEFLLGEYMKESIFRGRAQSEDMDCCHLQ